MATIDDIGTPGAPLSTPPLTEWQAAVRDSLKGPPWQPWSPTLAGFTASAVDCVYRRTHDGLVVAIGAFTVSAVTAASTFTLPVAATRQAIGELQIDLAGYQFTGWVRVSAGSSSAYLIVHYAAADYTRRVYVSPGVPATWAPNTPMTFNIVYQCAPLP